MSYAPTAFRPLAACGWGGKAASQWRGLQQTDAKNNTGRTVVNRGQVGTVQSRSLGPRVNLAITGISRDSVGNALGNATLELYHGKRMVAGTTSDGSGNFTFSNPGSGPFRIIADGTGVAGVSTETLTAT